MCPKRCKIHYFLWQNSCCCGVATRDRYRQRELKTDSVRITIARSLFIRYNILQCLKISLQLLFFKCTPVWITILIYRLFHLFKRIAFVSLPWASPITVPSLMPNTLTLIWHFFSWRVGELNFIKELLEKVTANSRKCATNSSAWPWFCASCTAPAACTSTYRRRSASASSRRFPTRQLWLVSQSLVPTWKFYQSTNLSSCS